jgi:hypothetical protein
VGNDLGLGAAEGAVAEHLLQHLGGIGGGGGSGAGGMAAGGAIGGGGGGPRGGRIRAPSQQFHHPGGWGVGNQRDSWAGSSALKALITRHRLLAPEPLEMSLQSELEGALAALSAPAAEGL